jgi:hypothetical protein
MATSTAFIFIGKSHSTGGGIIPTHYITYTENDRPGIILRDINKNKSLLVVVPSPDRPIDDIFLVIAIYVLKKVKPSRPIRTFLRKSVSEIITEEERLSLYVKAKTILKRAKIKVVFNLLDDCMLISKIDAIKEYPSDFEIAITSIKKENSIWTKKTHTMGM